MAKKRRSDSEAKPEVNKPQNGDEPANGDPHRMKKLKKKAMPTVSIAVPGSIIDNAQSLELATRLAGQIARAATIFPINEVVVFDNKNNPDKDANVSMPNNSEEEIDAAFLIRLLQYLETPKYLRKALFPKHNSLSSVGMLPPLDAPHHLRKHEWGPYREGVTLVEGDSNSMTTLIDVGLSKHVLVDKILEPGRRVTVARGANHNLDSDLPRQGVSSSKPREEGIYWGYQVRYAHNMTSVIKDCTYKIAFGGLAGLEESIEEDDNLKDVFNLYLNTCPHQGSRTIRTEEAMFISLQYFQEPFSEHWRDEYLVS